MPRISLPLLFLLVWCHVLLVTRPSEEDLREQWALKGELQPWLIEVMEKTVSTSPFQKPIGSLTTETVTDYGFFTVVWEPSKKNKDVFFFGLFGRFMPIRRSDFSFTWTRDSDVLFALALHIIAYCLFVFSPTVAFKLFSVNKWRPWTVLLSTFNTQSMWSLLVTGFMLVNVGQGLRDSLSEKLHPSLTFWSLYCLIPGVATLLTGVLLDSRASSLGGPGGILALCAYGTIRIPNARFLLFGQIRVGCFGMFLVEGLQVLSFNQYRHPVSLLFEIFAVGAMAILLYRVQHPFEAFDLKRISNLTINTIYAF